MFVPINYRLIPEATLQQMAGDVAKAVRWAYRNAREFGGDPRSILSWAIQPELNWRRWCARMSAT